MSSLYVRNLVRGWAKALPTPFYETVNLEQNPKDDVWLGIEFNLEFAEKTTYCDDWREEGTIELIISSKAGIGDNRALTQAEAIRTAFFSNTDPANKLVLEFAQPPQEFSGGAANERWYEIVVSVNYSYQP